MWRVSGPACELWTRVRQMVCSSAAGWPQLARGPACRHSAMSTMWCGMLIWTAVSKQSKGLLMIPAWVLSLTKQATVMNLRMSPRM